MWLELTGYERGDIHAFTCYWGPLCARCYKVLYSSGTYDPGEQQTVNNDTEIRFHLQCELYGALGFFSRNAANVLGRVGSEGWIGLMRYQREQWRVIRVWAFWVGRTKQSPMWPEYRKHVVETLESKAGTRPQRALRVTNESEFYSKCKRRAFMDFAQRSNMIQLMFL